MAALAMELAQRFGVKPRVSEGSAWAHLQHFTY